MLETVPSSTENKLHQLGCVVIKKIRITKLKTCSTLTSPFDGGRVPVTREEKGLSHFTILATGITEIVAPRHENHRCHYCKSWFSVCACDWACGRLYLCNRSCPPCSGTDQSPPASRSPPKTPARCGLRCPCETTEGRRENSSADVAC